MTERTELEKMLAGELYDASDRELAGMRERARDLCRLLNASPEADGDRRRSLFISLFGSGGETVNVQPPFFCDYGVHVFLGRKVFFNFNCVILDVCRGPSGTIHVRPRSSGLHGGPPHGS